MHLLECLCTYLCNGSSLKFDRLLSLLRRNVAQPTRCHLKLYMHLNTQFSQQLGSVPYCNQGYMLVCMT